MLGLGFNKKLILWVNLNLNRGKTVNIFTFFQLHMISYSRCLRWLETLGLLPTLMAWLDYFQLGFAQILLLIKVPNSRTYKSHRNTSQLKQRKTNHSNYSIRKHILALSIFHTMSWRGLLGPNPSVEHPKLTVLFQMGLGGTFFNISYKIFQIGF